MRSEFHTLWSASQLGLDIQELSTRIGCIEHSFSILREQFNYTLAVGGGRGEFQDFANSHSGRLVDYSKVRIPDVIGSTSRVDVSHQTFSSLHAKSWGVVIGTAGATTKGLLRSNNIHSIGYVCICILS